VFSLHIAQRYCWRKYGATHCGAKLAEDTDKVIFPWGNNHPTRRQRMTVSLIISIVAAATLYGSFVQDPSRGTDFGQPWFAARAMAQHRDPYPLVGPGREFPHEFTLYYPATAFLVALPFAALPQRSAAIIFVAVSVFLLTYGMTVDSWHRLPVLASASFMDSVLAAQMTILLTAALFLPWLAAFVAAKPQSGLPVLGAGSEKTLKAGIIGTVLLFAASLVLLPAWPVEWLANINADNTLHPPLLSPVGALVVLVLLRWRRPEAWLVFLMACLPQTFMWYSALALLTVGATYRETTFLSMTSTIGFLLGNLLIYERVGNLGLATWTVFVATTFIPAVFIILRRPNEGKGPFWLSSLMQLRARGLSTI